MNNIVKLYLECIIRQVITIELFQKLAISQLDLSNIETLKRINIVFEEEKLIFVTDETIEKEISETIYINCLSLSLIRIKNVK